MKNGLKRIGFIAFMLLFLCLLTSCGHEHKWCEWQIAKQTTCSQNGINTRVCDDCGESQSITIYATGHNFSEWNITKEATCMEDGSRERSCFCGEKETEIIYARGYHSYGNWNEIQSATCITESIKERVCSCGEKETETVSGFAKHTYEAGVCSVCKKEANCIKLTNLQSTITLPDVPLRVSNRATAAELASLEWTMDSSYVYITFSGEKTWSYFSGSSYIEFVFKIYDSEGYLIDDFSKKVWELSVGDKFKDVTVKIPISSLAANEDYEAKIIIH